MSIFRKPEWKEEVATTSLRYIVRETRDTTKGGQIFLGTERVLQQHWTITYYKGPKAVDRKWEWRDVPEFTPDVP